MNISPDFGAVGGIGDLRLIVGALLTYVLIFAVLMLVVSAIVWGIAASSGNYQLALRARTAVLVAVGAAALAGAAVALMNFLLGVGETL
ncbi:DUF6112 family protein [Demequina iriomotensis]|uniref:DUF6112 family protein n=1 Tax=Demequina iriomotensis TaxID=1536641 RepID=UPI00078541A5|nr:DUF6112 family protein [Demequina iriomotensis]